MSAEALPGYMESRSLQCRLADRMAAHLVTREGAMTHANAFRHPGTSSLDLALKLSAA